MIYVISYIFALADWCIAMYGQTWSIMKYEVNYPTNVYPSTLFRDPRCLKTPLQVANVCRCVSPSPCCLHLCEPSGDVWYPGLLLDTSKVGKLWTFFKPWWPNLLLCEMIRSSVYTLETTWSQHNQQENHFPILSIHHFWVSMLAGGCHGWGYVPTTKKTVTSASAGRDLGTSK